MTTLPRIEYKSLLFSGGGRDNKTPMLETTCMIHGRAGMEQTVVVTPGILLPQSAKDLRQTLVQQVPSMMDEKKLCNLFRVRQTTYAVGQPEKLHTLCKWTKQHGWIEQHDVISQAKGQLNRGRITFFGSPMASDIQNLSDCHHPQCAYQAVIGITMDLIVMNSTLAKIVHGGILSRNG
ncbi:hypothetical protein Tco_0123611 [Tanacetum coccineum]